MQCEIQLEKKLISPPVADYIKKQLIQLSPRYNSIIRRLRISARDLNGPRGGPDKEFCILAYLVSGKSVCFRTRGSDLYQAIDLGCEKAKTKFSAIKTALLLRRRGGKRAAERI